MSMTQPQMETRQRICSAKKHLWKTENFKGPPTAQILSKNDL